MTVPGSAPGFRKRSGRGLFGLAAGPDRASNFGLRVLLRILGPGCSATVRTNKDPSVVRGAFRANEIRMDVGKNRRLISRTQERKFHR